MGGTRIRAALLGGDGRLLRTLDRPTDAHRGPAAVLATLTDAIHELAARCPQFTSIGVACAGLVQPDTGVITQGANLGWRDVPLGATLERAFSVPILVENDVRAAAWGEFRFGAARGVRSCLAVFVGTGIGSGAILDGVLWRGAENAAGELGHTQVVVRDGLVCACGQRGCLESYASGAGLARRLAHALSDRVPTRLAGMTNGDPSRLTASMVEDAAAAGDPFAEALWRDVVDYLVAGVANYVTLMNPDLVVLGGGVVDAVPPLLARVRDGVRSRVAPVLGQSLCLSPAALGDWSGVVGAGDLAAVRAGAV